MTTATLAPTVSGAPHSTGVLNNLKWLVSDTLTLTKRNLLAVTRIPEALFFSTVQPIMFVLLFRYVFGGAIHTGPVPYVDYLLPGIFVQTVAFGSVSTSIGLAEDLQKGIIERFRALPMSRGAVLLGRTTADLVRNVFVVIIMTVVGLLVGFRPSEGFASFMAGIGLILLFAYALSWFFAIVGLSAPNSETAQVMSFPLVFPLTFISAAFVQVGSMPSWLQGFATYQPFSVTISACRSLMVGAASTGTGRSTTFWVIQSLAWTIGLLIVMIPLAIRRYRTRT
jgi:ABC-2 type transport system permease protein